MENLIIAKSETSDNPAIVVESDLFEGVRAVSHSGDFHAAIVGINDNQTLTAGYGVYGKSRGAGVLGKSETWHGVAGISESVTGGAGIHGKGNGAGVIGEGETWHGVAGISKSSIGGVGIYGQNPNGNAGQFDGNVIVQGNFSLTGELLINNVSLLDQIKKQNAAFSTRLTDQNNTISSLNNRIGGLSSQLENLKNQVNTMRHEVDKLNNKLFQSG